MVYSQKFFRERKILKMLRMGAFCTPNTLIMFRACDLYFIHLKSQANTYPMPNGLLFTLHKKAYAKIPKASKTPLPVLLGVWRMAVQWGRW